MSYIAYLILYQNTTKIKQISLQEGDTASIGRAGSGNNLELDGGIYSGKHAIVELLAKGLFITDKSTNGTSLNNASLAKDQRSPLKDGDKITFTSQGDYRLEVTLEAIDVTSYAKSKEPVQSYQHSSSAEFASIVDAMGNRSEIIIGRDPSCDISLPELIVSRLHAKIIKSNGGYMVEDLGSSNGTFLNGEQIKANKPIVFPADALLQIGLYQFDLNNYTRDIRKSDSPAIRVSGLSKTYTSSGLSSSKAITALQSTNLEIGRNKLVAVMGPSGCGKSTLIKCLCGYENSKGKITINDLSLKEQYDRVKQFIGYVPQEDIVHDQLTVNQALYYAGKMRLSADKDAKTGKEFQKKIDDILQKLGIYGERDKKIKELSGGQRKRVSIAVELLNPVSILFLDEPTSPLDPETIGKFLEEIRSLIKQKNITVVMVTHRPGDLKYVDEVLFMAKGGYITYQGSPDDLVPSFQNEGVKAISDIYHLVSDKQKLNVVKERYHKISTANPVNVSSQQQVERVKRSSGNLFAQYGWLSLRNFQIKLNDQGNLLYLLLQPVIIAGLVVLIFNHFQVGVIFLSAIAAIWFGVNNASKEIVDEFPIYKRERMFNLGILSYLFAKLTSLSALALVQVIIFTAILSIGFFSNEFYLSTPIEYGLFMWFLSISATLIGLFISGVSKTSERAMTMVPIVLMPQIMLAGIITPINGIFKELLSYLTLGRWGTQGLAFIQDSNPVEIKEYMIDPMMEEMGYDTMTVHMSYQFMNDIDELVKKDTATMAMKQLNLYSSELISDGKLIGCFNGLADTHIPIILLNTLLFASVFYALKRKDPI